MTNSLFKHKKSQGLSMNIIVIAAIALLILVILTVIFIGRMRGTAREVDRCKGDCIDDPDECVGKYQKLTNDPCFDEAGDVNPDKYCCISVV